MSLNPLRLFTLMVMLATVALPPAPAAAVTSLSFGQERQLSANAVAPWTYRISVASNGFRYLAVWPEGKTSGGPGQVRGAIIEPNGTVVARMEILTSPYGIANAVVAWNGRSFFVIADYDPDGYYSRELFGKMVSSDGKVLSSEPILITQPGNTYKKVRPALAGNTGTNSFYVAWHATIPYIGHRSIFGAVVTKDGFVGPSTMLATPEFINAPPDNAAVVSDGTDFFAAWDERGHTPGCTCTMDQIYGTPVTAAGTPVVEGGAQITLSPYGAFYPSIASDGSQYLLAWGEGYGGAVRAARLTPAGMASGPAVAVSSTRHWYDMPTAAAWDGKSFLVAWRDAGGGSSAGRVGADGSLIDSAAVSIGSGVAPALAGLPPFGKGAAVFVNSTPRLRLWTQ